VNEREAMARAIVLAERGWGRVHPNPMVGAVLLKDGQMIAEGWHQEFGGLHAEANAVSAAGELAQGATCVVTLEPCTHHGKTKPCTDVLIQAGVARVVCAVRDPNPEAAGGIGVLHAAGIQAEHGLFAEEAARMNAAFLCGLARPDRPWIAVKVATSSDGFLASTDRHPQFLSGLEARDWVQWLRAGFDAIGIGRVTLETDNPQLTVRGPLMPRVPPIRVVFSANGRMPVDRLLFRTEDVAPVLVATTPAGASRAPVETVVGDDLSGMLGALRARGVRSLLVEGGAALIQSMLAEDVVDRIYWIRARTAMETGVSAFGGFRPGESEDSGWRVVRRLALGPDTLLVTDRRLCLPDS